MKGALVESGGAVPGRRVAAVAGPQVIRIQGRGSALVVITRRFGLV
jgi:hypothetical protein